MMRSPSLAFSPVVSVSRTTWRVIVIRNPLVGELVGALVFRVPGVAAHPVPLYLMFCRQLGELLPEVHVLDRLLVGRTPAAALPVVDPGRDALLHVERVRVHAHAAGPLERLERPDDGHELHAIVGRARFAAVDLLFGAFRPQDGAPAARAGIAAAGAVAVDLDDIVSGHGGSCGCAAKRSQARGAAPVPCATAG